MCLLTCKFLEFIISALDELSKSFIVIFEEELNDLANCYQYLDKKSIITAHCVFDVELTTIAVN